MGNMYSVINRLVNRVIKEIKVGYLIIALMVIINAVAYHYTGNIVNVGAGGFCLGLLTALIIFEYYG